MAKRTLSNVKLWYAQYDLSTWHNEASIDYKAADVEAPSFGDGYKTVLPGLKEFSVGAAGYLDFAAGPPTPAEAVWQPAVGVGGIPLTIAPITGTEGEACYLMLPNVIQFDPYSGITVGGAAKFKLGAAAAGVPLVRGTVLRNATDTTTGTGTIFQLGAVAAGQKIYCAAHAFGVTGSGGQSLTIALQSAATVGFGSPTTRYTFTAFTSAGSAWMPPISGAITDQYWRITYTIAGSSPSCQYAVAAGII